MRSSPAYAGLALELPATTLAARVPAVLVPLAGAFGVAVALRLGFDAAAAVPALLAGAALAMQARNWTRSGRAPALRLECGADGTLQLHGAAPAPVRATLGPRTRRLGPSVFLDLRFAIGGRERRLGCWLTHFDVPAGVLRRWTVVLPARGHAARS